MLEQEGERKKTQAKADKKVKNDLIKKHGIAKPKFTTMTDAVFYDLAKNIDFFIVSQLDETKVQKALNENEVRILWDIYRVATKLNPDNPTENNEKIRHQWMDRIRDEHLTEKQITAVLRYIVKHTLKNI